MMRPLKFNGAAKNHEEALSEGGGGVVTGSQQ
jgi:hypothetical protein